MKLTHLRQRICDRRSQPRQLQSSEEDEKDGDIELSESAQDVDKRSNDDVDDDAIRVQGRGGNGLIVDGSEDFDIDRDMHSQDADDARDGSVDDSKDFTIDHNIFRPDADDVRAQPVSEIGVEKCYRALIHFRPAA